MSEWKEVKLKNCISTLKGYAFKSAWYVKKGTPIIRVSDFSIDSVNTENLIYVNSDIAKTYSKYALIKNDVIIQTVGSWASNPASVVGKVIKIPNSVENGLLNQNAVKLIPNTLIDKKYLFYLLKGELFKGYVIGCAQGAASQASITLETIYNYHFLLPPLPTQKRISNILSNYDNLIENNQKRIEILEKMAQNLYKEWFVRFRFPNWESVEFVDGLPIGWEKSTLEDIASITSSKRIYAKDYVEKGIPFFRSKEIIELSKHSKISTPLYISKDRFEELDRKFGIPKEGDILMTSVGTLGVLYKVRFNDKFYFKDGNLMWFKKKENYIQTYLYYFLKSPFGQGELKKTAIGSSQSAFTIVSIKQLKIVIPNNQIVRQFYDKVNPIEKLINNLALKNNILKQERNCLLPRLLSGKLEV